GGRKCPRLGPRRLQRAGEGHQPEHVARRGAVQPDPRSVARNGRAVVEPEPGSDPLPHARMQHQERQQQPEEQVLDRHRQPAQNRVPTVTPGSKMKCVVALGPGLVTSSTATPGESWTAPRSNAPARPMPAERTGDHWRIACESVTAVTVPELSETVTVLSCQARIQYARRNGDAVSANRGFSR